VREDVLEKEQDRASC